MVKRTRGVTLVEILLIVIIIGILSGLFSLSSSHATDKANETACANNRRTLRSAYIVAKTSDNSASFKKLIETIMADYLNAEKVELADSTAVYKKLCPGEGSYCHRRTIIDPNRRKEIDPPRPYSYHWDCEDHQGGSENDKEWANTDDKTGSTIWSNSVRNREEIGHIQEHCEEIYQRCT